jgi:hypothetical protein
MAGTAMAEARRRKKGAELTPGLEPLPPAVFALSKAA